MKAGMSINLSHLQHPTFISEMLDLGTSLRVGSKHYPPQFNNTKKPGMFVSLSHLHPSLILEISLF
jgi:hypothetical protein